MKRQTRRPCPGKRYEIRAWAPSARARRREGEIRVKTYWFCNDDPHYVATELYRSRHEVPRWRFEVLDYGPGGRNALGAIVTYDELLHRSRSLVAKDPTRVRDRSRSRSKLSREMIEAIRFIAREETRGMYGADPVRFPSRTYLALFRRGLIDSRPHHGVYLTERGKQALRAVGP